MEIVEEARDFVQAKMQSRVALLRAKTRRLQQLSDESDGHCSQTTATPQAESTEPSIHLINITKCRARDKSFKAVASGRIKRPVLAFTFHRRQSLRRLPLDLDGSVASMQGSFSTRAESALGRQRRDRWSLQSASAWTPWPRAPTKTQPDRFSYSLEDDSEDEAVVFRKPRYVTRESTWEGLGYCGLLGHESINESVKLKPSGSFEESQLAKAIQSHESRRQEEGAHDGLQSLVSKEHLPACDEDESHVARRISSDERAKWRSSFNRFRHDGEIHRDDLNKALAHCGFDDRRQALIDEALEQVTRYTALNREEFMQFVCLYESRLHDLYRTEFLKYETSPGAMSVQSLPLLLQELGLEPRRVVLEELLKEVCRAGRPEVLGFRDVAAVMELLRAREGFLVAELDRFRGVFQDFDSDASGDMCAGELGSALSWLGFPYTNDKVQSLYKESDMNGNGVLSESEFVICLRHIQDAELSTIRQFLRERAVANGYGQRISSVRELEALLIKLGYQASAAALIDAMQEAGFCGKTDPEQLIDLSGIRMDMDDVCTLLHCLRNREGFTDAQMNDLRKAFQRNKSDDTERIPTSVLHKVLRWLGHCYTFDRAQQLIYEADPMGDQLDYTTFVKLVRKCRDFDRHAAVAAFHAADESRSGVLEPSEQLEALSTIDLAEFHHLPGPDEKDFTLERFLLRVSKYQEDRLLFLRKFYCFTVAEYETLRCHFNRSDKEGNGTLRRYELARLVETLFPHQSHMPEFRPILVKLLKEANADKSPATDLMALLAVTRKIKDESDVYHCSVYQKTLQSLNFSCREAAEFLSIYLPITEEGSRPVTCEDMLSLFIRSFEMTDGECQLLQAVFNEVLEEKGSGNMVNLGSRGEPGLDFLGFMLVMRRVIEVGVATIAN